MKALIGFAVLMITICYAGDLKTPQSSFQTHNTQRPTTLFSIDAQNHNSVELWESSLYQTQGMDVQIRWQKQGDHITVAKSCEIQGHKVVAQVTITPAMTFSSNLNNRVQLTKTLFCEIQMETAPNDNDFQILDQHIVFSETLSDDAIELQILSHKSSDVTAVFQKIKSDRSAIL